MMVCWRLLLFALALLGSARGAYAHKGPPFPILMDVVCDELVVSVWADPDIGEATFFIVVEAAGGGEPADELAASMWAEPVGGRLDRVSYGGTRQKQRGAARFAAQPYFDQRDFWAVGFRIERPGREAVEVATQVESTPPGFGPWDLLVYGFPFILLGGLWVAALLQQRKRQTVAASAAS